MYEVQPNCSAQIAETIDMGSAYGLGLFYYQPVRVLKEDQEFIISSLLEIAIYPRAEKQAADGNGGESYQLGDRVRPATGQTSDEKVV
jgi:hypothetical protein